MSNKIYETLAWERSYNLRGVIPWTSAYYTCTAVKNPYDKSSLTLQARVEKNVVFYRKRINVVFYRKVKSSCFGAFVLLRKVFLPPLTYAVLSVFQILTVVLL